MNRWGIRLGLCVALSLVGLAWASPATAAPDDREPRVLEATFDLPETNGYQVSFGAREGRGEHGSTLTFNGDDTFVEYSVEPKVLSGRRLEVDYGDLGHISLRFKADRSKKPKCDVRQGTFRGEVSFEADGGLGTVDVAKVEGQVGRPPTIGVCIPGLYDRAAEPLGHARAPEFQSLFSCNPRSGYSYGALSNLFEERGTTHFAELRSTIGAVTVDRSVFVDAPNRTLRITGNGDQAVARPPKPFSGSAKLSGGKLTGSLSVPLPGLAEPVQLTPAIASAGRGLGRRCDGLFGTPESGAEILRSGS